MRAAPVPERRNQSAYMSEENENQSATGPTRRSEPAPLETAANPGQQDQGQQQRPRRGRRRYPRRRFYDRGPGPRTENFGGDSYNNDSPNSGEGDGAVEGEAGAAEGEGADAQREPEFGEGIVEISGKGFGFLRD